MKAPKSKAIIEILRKHEDSLSDNFVYYSMNVEAELQTIANEIIEALEEIEAKVGATK